MIEGRKELGKKSRDSYWNLYFYYKTKASELHEIAQIEIDKEVQFVKETKKYIDGQQLVSSVLTNLGKGHKFHRQFDEKFDYKKNQILGMQLYMTMLKDNWDWNYTETKHKDHLYDHAVYFSPTEI